MACSPSLAHGYNYPHRHHRCPSLWIRVEHGTAEGHVFCSLNSLSSSSASDQFGAHLNLNLKPSSSSNFSGSFPFFFLTFILRVLFVVILNLLIQFCIMWIWVRSLLLRLISLCWVSVFFLLRKCISCCTNGLSSNFLNVSWNWSRKQAFFSLLLDSQFLDVLFNLIPVIFVLYLRLRGSCIVKRLVYVIGAKVIAGLSFLVESGLSVVLRHHWTTTSTNYYNQFEEGIWLAALFCHHCLTMLMELGVCCYWGMCYIIHDYNTLSRNANKQKDHPFLNEFGDISLLWAAKTPPYVLVLVLEHLTDSRRRFSRPTFKFLTLSLSHLVIQNQTLDLSIAT